MGDSIGHWEGDTLVVDTTNFPPQQNFRGSSENLHVVERFRRVDARTINLPVHRGRPDDLYGAVYRRNSVSGHGRVNL